MNQIIASFRKASRPVAVRILFWVLLFLIPTSTWLNDGVTRVQFFALGFYFLLFFSWLMLRRQRGPLRIHVALLAYFAYLLWMIIRLPASPIKSHGIEIILDITLFGFFLLFCFDLLNTDSDYEPVFTALFIVGGLFAIVNTLQIVNWTSAWMKVDVSSTIRLPFAYRLPGTFLGHPNIEAGFVGLLIPLALVRLLYAKTKLRKASWIGLLLSFLIVEYFSSSRAGWISAAAGITTTLLILAYVNKSPRNISPSISSFFKGLKKRWLLVVLFLSILFGITALLWFQASNTPHQPLASARASVWSAGVEIFKLAPFLGNGPGSTHVLVVAVDRLLAGRYFIHPHNVLLMVADEGGLFAVALVALGLAYFVLGFRSKWEEMEVKGRIKTAGTIGALVTIIVHNQADVLFEAPIYWLAAVVACTHLLPRSLNSTVSLRIPNWMPLIALLLFSVVQLNSFRGIRDIELGVGTFTPYEQQDAAELICAGGDKYMSYALTSAQCALALSRDSDDVDLARALSYQQKTISNDPYWPMHWLNLGVLQWQGGDQTNAMSSLREGIKRAPRSARLLINYGWMAESEGDQELAEVLYRDALKFHPLLQASVFFQSTNFRNQILDSQNQFEDRGESFAAHVDGWRSLSNKDYSRALKDFERSLSLSPRNSQARIGYARSLQALGRDTEAWNQANLAVLGNSPHPRILLGAGTIAFAQGRLIEAESFLNQGWDAIRWQSESNRYYSIVYRRSVLPYDVVSGAIDPHVYTDMVEALEILADIQTRAGHLEKATEIEEFIQSAQGHLD